MDFQLSEEQRMLQETVREFADRECRPLAAVLIACKRRGGTIVGLEYGECFPTLGAGHAQVDSIVGGGR